MARIAKLWWCKERRQWCVVHGGRRYRLGRDRAAATLRWHQIVGGGGVGREPAPHPTGPAAAALTVAQLIDAYSAALPTWAGRAAVLSTRFLLRPFRERFGGRRVESLVETDFEAVAVARGWGQSSRNLAKRRWAAACNWAIRSGRLAANPLRGLPTGTTRPRTVRSLLSPAEAAALLAAANPKLRDVLLVLHDTGCRPGEALAATGGDFDPVGGRLVLRTSKTGRPRVVYVTDRVAALLRRLAAASGDGPLLEFGRRGKAEHRSSYLSIAFRRLADRLKLRPEVTAYSFRHSFATDLLAKGVPDATVAELLGNTVRILHAHYAHVEGRADALRRTVREARGG